MNGKEGRRRSSQESIVTSQVSGINAEFRNVGIASEGRVPSEERLRHIRSELVHTGVIIPQDQSATLRCGDFSDIGTLKGNTLVLPHVVAEHVKEKGREFAEGRGFVKPWYFVEGNPTALSYPGTARNRSTMTTIATLEDGRRIFLIDPKSSGLHRWSDTLMRHLSGNPARKVSESEWKSVFIGKSRIPVLNGEGDDIGAFPYKDVIALPYIPNVNGIDFFAHNKEIDFSEEFSWAGRAGVDEKVMVAKNALSELSVIHSEGIAWGEPAAHNMMIAHEGRSVMIVDPEVQYDTGVPLLEAQARDVLDLTISIAGAMNIASDIGGGEYQDFVTDLFTVYPDHEVLEEAVRIVEQTSLTKRMLYPVYEQKRLNNLPFAEYQAITAAIHSVS
ncbi:MAG: hypothetical protein RLZZ455_3 [Candidatus Parcubacteria bacterium]|jgi:hypothetical protein